MDMQSILQSFATAENGDQLTSIFFALLLGAPLTNSDKALLVKLADDRIAEYHDIAEGEGMRGSAADLVVEIQSALALKASGGDLLAGAAMSKAENDALIGMAMEIAADCYLGMAAKLYASISTLANGAHIPDSFASKVALACDLAAKTAERLKAGALGDADTKAGLDFPC